MILHTTDDYKVIDIQLLSNLTSCYNMLHAYQMLSSQEEGQQYSLIKLMLNIRYLVKTQGPSLLETASEHP